MYDPPRIKATYTQVDIHSLDFPDVQVCLTYWQRLRGERFAPAWHEFDWSEIPLQLIPCFGVVDIHRDPLDFVYRFWGSHHARVSRQELTGQSVSAMHPDVESRSVFAQYEETLNAKCPLLFTNKILAPSRGPELLEISLRLPFSDDGESVSHIVAFSDIRKDMRAIEKVFTKR